MKQNVLITAGAAGIGYAIAKRFMERGDRVAVCDVDVVAIDRFRANHPNAIACHADVTDETQMIAFFETVEHAWNHVDIVCANAGTGGPAGAIETLDYTEWQACIAANVHGAFLTCRWAARIMKAQKSGVIILTSSTAGILGYPFRSPYASAKWAIVGLTKTLAMELGGYGIRVNAICPGAVEGPRMDRVVAKEAAARGMHEDDIRALYVTGVSMKTWVNAEDVVNTVAFLTSDAASKVSGQIMAIDGHSETLAP